MAKSSDGRGFSITPFASHWRTAALSKIVGVPKGMCEVTGDNDPQQRWIPVEAASAFEAAIYYWGMVTALMAAPSIPRPTPETIFHVRIDGEFTACGGSAR